jgi:uncharacterized protein YjbI with pentapeptide repeats
MRNIDSYSKHVMDRINENDSEEYASQIRILKKNGELIATVNSDSLSGLDLSGRILTSADLSRKYLKETVFVEAILDWCDLYGADLTGSNLRGADLTNANLTGAILTGANFQDSQMEEANMENCDSALGANFSGAYMHHVEANHSNMEGCSFSGAKMYSCKMNNCNLEVSDFSGANIIYVDFRRSNLRNAIGLEKTKNPETANFKHCDLTGVSVEFFMRLVKAESEGDLAFWEEPPMSEQTPNGPVTLEDFLMGCKGVPWSAIRKTKKSKNLFGI